MNMNANSNGWRMPSLGHALAVLLTLSLNFLSGAFAQTPGEVQLTVGSDGQYILDLSGKADPNGTNAFIFEFPDLWAETVEGPDFSESDFCGDGCNFDWIQVGDTLRGVEIQLPSTSYDSGFLAQVAGWPIIDNIDFKSASSSEPCDTEGLIARITSDGLWIACGDLRCASATIEVWDTQGNLMARIQNDTGQSGKTIQGLPPGVYFARCYSGDAIWQKKVLISR